MSADAPEKPSFAGWAILELMGHRRLGGYVQEQMLFGSAMCRIDIPAVGEYEAVTQFYGGGSIYCLTPCKEELARRVAGGFHPEPVHEWQLPKPTREVETEEDWR